MCPHVPLKPNHIFVLSQSIKRANTRNFCVEIKRRQLHLLLFFSHKVMSDSFATPQTIAHPAPLSVGFSRQEHWSGLPFPSPGHLPNPRIEPQSISCIGRQILSHCTTWEAPTPFTGLHFEYEELTGMVTVKQ